MPYSIIHLEIADRLIKNYNYENNYFYIGNLAPDAISLNKNATIEDKRQVHLYGARSIEERFNSINQMYVKYKNKISTDFLDGWTSHLLTDNLWLYLLNWNFKYEYESSMESVKKEEMYRRENKILESKLFNEKSMEYGDIIEKIHDIENIETPSNLTEKEMNGYAL